MICSQCGSEMVEVKDSEIAATCRCGVVNKWWKPRPGERALDGPDLTSLDLLQLQRNELWSRLKTLWRIMRTIESLRLDDDGKYFAARTDDLVQGITGMLSWAEWLEDRLWRFYGAPGDFDVHGKRPLALIDAAVEIDRIAKDRPAPAPTLGNARFELGPEWDALGVEWVKRRKGPLV